MWPVAASLSGCAREWPLSRVFVDFMSDQLFSVRWWDFFGPEETTAGWVQAFGPRQAQEVLFLLHPSVARRLLREGLGDKADKMIVASNTYETTDPTINSQILSLQGSGADTLLVAAIPKFAAQAIRKVADLGWKPNFFMTNVSVSVGSVMKPAGFDKAQGTIAGGYLKDPNAIRSGRTRPSTRIGWSG